MMIIIVIIYHGYVHVWVDSANKKYSELKSLRKRKAFTFLIKRRRGVYHNQKEISCWVR